MQLVKSFMSHLECMSFDLVISERSPHIPTHCQQQLGIHGVTSLPAH